MAQTRLVHKSKTSDKGFLAETDDLWRKGFFEKVGNFFNETERLNKIVQKGLAHESSLTKITSNTT